jgi:hypothetical protein
MRTRITSKAWFGPRTSFGWGWRPTSWEGWLTTAVFLVLVAVSILIWPHAVLISTAALVVLLVIVLLLTGDSPGGQIGGPPHRNDSSL